MFAERSFELMVVVAVIMAGLLSAMQVFIERFQGKTPSVRRAALYGGGFLMSVAVFELMRSLSFSFQISFLFSIFALVILAVLASPRLGWGGRDPGPLPRTLRPPLPSERDVRSPEADRYI